MASTITAGNSTNGLGVTSDNTGALDIKTGTGAGTTAISIDASQNVTMPGSLTVTGSLITGSGTPYALVEYTSPSTWDATAKIAAGLRAIKVTVVGAGGNGGAVTGVSTVAGGGGGAGGATVAYVPVSNISPGPKTVTAGAGANSFGPWGTATPFSPTATVSATAGTAGTSSNPGGGASAPGGVGTGGQLNVTGGAGVGFANTVFNYGSDGGNSIFGGSGGGAFRATSPAGATAGNPGNAYGAGGGGAAKTGPSPAVAAGGTGAPGIVIVEEFY